MEDVGPDGSRTTKEPALNRQRCVSKMRLVALLCVISALVALLVALRMDSQRPNDKDLLLVPHEVVRKGNGLYQILDLSGLDVPKLALLDNIKALLDSGGMVTANKNRSAEGKLVWDLDRQASSWIATVDWRSSQGDVIFAVEGVTAERLQPMVLRAYVEAVVQRASVAFDRLDLALLAPDFVVPADPKYGISGCDLFLKQSSRWQRLARLLTFSAAMHLSRGDVDAAIEDCRRLVWFGRRLIGARGALLGASLGSEFEGMGVKCLFEIACGTNLPVERLRRIVRDIAVPDDRVTAMVMNVRAQYTWISSLLNDPVPGEGFKGFATGLFYSPNRIRNRYVDAYRALLETLDQPGAPAPAVWIRQPSGPSTWLDLSGQHLTAGLGEQCAMIRNDLWEAVLRANLRIAVLGIKAHLTHEGKRPTTLGELVPHYLDRVPTDPWDGKPLRWSAELGAVYCNRGGLPDPRYRVDIDRLYPCDPSVACLWIDDYLPVRTKSRSTVTKPEKPTETKP